MLQVFDESFAKQFLAVARWFMTLVHQPQFSKVMGDVEIPKQPMKYDPKKASAAAPKKESKPEQPKKEKPPAAAAKVGIGPLRQFVSCTCCEMALLSGPDLGELGSLWLIRGFPALLGLHLCGQARNFAQAAVCRLYIAITSQCPDWWLWVCSQQPQPRQSLRRRSRRRSQKTL